MKHRIISATLALLFLALPSTVAEGQGNRSSSFAMVYPADGTEPENVGRLSCFRGMDEDELVERLDLITYSSVMVDNLFPTNAQCTAVGEQPWGAHPYDSVPHLDLNKTMGYLLLFPNKNAEAQVFCDTLEIFLPRTDVRRGAGVLHLLTREDAAQDWTKVCEVNFEDEKNVRLRPMTADECDSLIWKEGMCAGIHLPRSLEAGRDYSVSMEPGCLTATDGRVYTDRIIVEMGWQPALNVDREGVEALYYSRQSDGEFILVSEPMPGDRIDFDLTLSEGEWAKLVSENDSVIFEENKIDQSGHVKGSVAGENVRWRIDILSDTDGLVESIRLNPNSACKTRAADGCAGSGSGASQASD